MTQDIAASGGTPTTGTTDADGTVTNGAASSTQAATSVFVDIEELRRWTASNEALTAATTALAERMATVASSAQIDAAMEQRMATVERETGEALAASTVNLRATRARAWILIGLSLLFSVLISMQLRDVVAYQCYPRAESGREANVSLCDAVFPFSPHDFGNQTGVSTARALGSIGYAAVLAGMVGAGLVYRRRYRHEFVGSDRLLRHSAERSQRAQDGRREADRVDAEVRLRSTQHRRRKDDPPPVQDPAQGEDSQQQ